MPILRCCVDLLRDERLDGQVELLALHDLGPVDVEEVGVQDSLDEAGDDGDGVEEALHCVSAGERKSVSQQCMPSQIFGSSFPPLCGSQRELNGTYLQIQLGMYSALYAPSAKM